MVESQPPQLSALGLSLLRGTFVGRLQMLAGLKAALGEGLADPERLMMLAGVSAANYSTLRLAASIKSKSEGSGT